MKKSSNQNPVLFLDFDGVIVVRGNPTSKSSVRAVRQLQRVIDVTKTELVISSSWRRAMTLIDLAYLLKEWGLDRGRIIGKTPILTPDVSRRPGSPILDGPYQRGHEIQTWLNQHPSHDRFAIVDDDSDMDAIGFDRFVQTDYMVGLTRSNATRLITILKGDST